MQQLTLNLQLNQPATFENFHGTANQLVVSQLKQLTQEAIPQKILIWSEAALGKTHLLQATCHYFSQHALRSIYLPMHQLKQTSTAVLDNIEKFNVICIDDVDVCLGDGHWERALFNLYNLTETTGCHLVFSATQSPQHLTFQLPDLRSRLSACLIMPLHALNDQEKKHLLQQLAKQQAFDLPDEVAEFLINHADRRIDYLLNALHKLEEKTLIEQRRLTIPFVKKVLEL